MQYATKPAGWPAAIEYPPPYPTATVYQRALLASPLTKADGAAIRAAGAAIAEAEREIADASPAGVKAALDRLVERGRAGDENVSVADVRAAAGKLEAATAAEAAVRDLLAPRIAAAQHSVDGIALRLLAAAEDALKSIAAEVDILTKTIADLTGDAQDQAFWSARFQHTLPAFEAVRKAIADGGALEFLRHQIGVPEAA